jgi:hypothetical protein
MAQPVNVLVRDGEIHLPGDLLVPPRAAGLVIFAHGSGSGRHSPRNRAVAESLAASGLATLLSTCSQKPKNASIGTRQSCGSTSSCWPGAY